MSFTLSSPLNRKFCLFFVQGLFFFFFYTYISIVYLNALIRSAHSCVCVCRSSTDQSSAVCAFNANDISEVFSRGKFKTEVSVEMSDVKWVMYNGEIPVPRPGAVSGHYWSYIVLYSLI